MEPKHNSDANCALVVVNIVLVLITAFYAYLTYGVLSEMRETNRLANRPFFSQLSIKNGAGEIGLNSQYVVRKEENKEKLIFAYNNVGKSVASIIDIKIRVCEEGRLTEPVGKLIGEPLLAYPYHELLPTPIKSAPFQQGTFWGNDSDTRERTIIINNRVRYKGVDDNTEYEYENIIEAKIKNGTSIVSNTLCQRDVVAPLPPLKENECMGKR